MTLRDAAFDASRAKVPKLQLRPDELLFRCLILGTRLIDGEGCSCIYVPITQDVKVVDSQGYVFDLEDE